MEHFITLCRASAAAAEDPEYASELVEMADAITLGIQARVAPAFLRYHQGQLVIRLRSSDC